MLTLAPTAAAAAAAAAARQQCCAKEANVAAPASLSVLVKCTVIQPTHESKCKQTL
jgi:hypothetical protein